jgi:hypothetical protein
VSATRVGSALLSPRRLYLEAVGPIWWPCKGCCLHDVQRFTTPPPPPFGDECTILPPLAFHTAAWVCQRCITFCTTSWVWLWRIHWVCLGASHWVFLRHLPSAWQPGSVYDASTDSGQPRWVIGSSSIFPSVPQPWTLTPHPSRIHMVIIGMQNRTFGPYLKVPSKILFSTRPVRPAQPFSTCMASHPHGCQLGPTASYSVQS